MRLWPEKKYFSKILSLIFALSWPGDTGCCGNGEARDREGSDGCFLCFFFSFFFFRQGHFPTQVFTCQEEIQTSYGHRCGHIWSQYGVLRFMGIELRMWYYDTLDCTNIYICYPIGVLGQEKSDAGQPDPPNQPEAKYPSGVAGFSLVCFTHTHIYICTRQVFGRKSAP